MEEKFNDMGVDAWTGSEIMRMSGVSTSDIKSPPVFNKLMDIVQYVKDMPAEHRSFFMNKVTAGKNVDKLEHLWGYVELNKRKDTKMKELDSLKEELSFYER